MTVALIFRGSGTGRKAARSTTCLS
jgi:hypothetical protein